MSASSSSSPSIGPVLAAAGDTDSDSSSSSCEDVPEEHVGYWTRMRRSLAYSAGTSTLGRQAIIKYLPWETQNLIQALYRLVELDTGSKEAAYKLESTLMKFLVKLAIDHEGKRISYKDLLLADAPLREAFELLIKLFYYCGETKTRNLRPHFEQVERHFLEVVAIVRGILKRSVRWSPNELARLDKVVKVVGTADFLVRVWDHPEAEPPLLDLYDSMLKYTAFHYYSKSSGDLSKPTRNLDNVKERAAKKVARTLRRRTRLSKSAPGISSSKPSL